MDREVLLYYIILYLLYNIAFPSESSLIWIRREKCTDQGLFTSENSQTYIVGFWSEKTTDDGLFTEGSVMHYSILSGIDSLK